MVTADCQCGSPVKGLTVGVIWTPCENCGVEHRLVAPRAGSLLILAGCLTLASFVVGSVGRHFQSTSVTVLGFSTAGVLGFYSIYSVINLLLNRQGVHLSRPTAFSDCIAKLTEDLARLERRLNSTTDESFQQCKQALATLDQLTQMPRTGQWLRAKAIAMSAVSANYLGQTKSVRDYLSRLSKLDKSAKPFYWKTYFYSRVNDVSLLAVHAYFRVLKTPSAATESLRGTVTKAVAFACTIQSEMSPDELRKRAKWNQEAAKLFKNERWPILNEAWAWYYLERFDRCISMLENHVPNVENWPFQVLLAQAEYKKGSSLLAEYRIGTLEQWSADRPKIAIEVALVYIRWGHMDRAEPFLLNCEKVGGEVAACALVIRAKLHFQAGDLIQAQSALKDANKNDPNNIQAILLLAEIMSAGGEHGEAAKTLALAAKKHRRNANLLLAMGRNYWNAGEFGAAIDAFESSVRNGALPDSIAVIRARCLLSQNRFEEAAFVLDQAVDVPPIDHLPATFFHGVALLKLAQQSNGRGAARALPYFANATKRAKESGDTESVKKARINTIHCYRMISEESFDSGNWREAARAFQILAKSFRSDSENARVALANAAEALFRAAVDALESGRNQIALECLEQSVVLRRSQSIELILGAVLFRTAEYGRAEQRFGQLLEDVPNDDRCRFYRALSSVRNGRQLGFRFLRQLLKEPGEFRLRVALALADWEAESGAYDAAALTLTTVLTENSAVKGDLQKDHFFGECCCKAVLYTVRDGRAADASNLIGRLLDGKARSNEKILGAILAEVGDFERALPVLCEWVKSNPADSNTNRLLTGVAIRVGMKHCAAGKFEAARTAVAKGLIKGVDQQTMLFSQLLDVTCEDQGERGELGERTVHLLEKCAEQSRELSLLTARPIIVGAQIRMLVLAREGDYQRAEGFGARAKLCWNERVRTVPKFWDTFIEAYNEGKEHQMKTPGSDVAKAIAQRLTGLWVHNMEKSITGEFRNSDDSVPRIKKTDYDALRFCWTSLKSLVGENSAIETARQHINFSESVARISRELGSEEAVTFVKFVQRELYPDERLSGFIVNHVMGALLDSLSELDGNGFRKHLEDLISFATGNAELKSVRDIGQGIRSMGIHVQDRILTTMRGDRDLTQLRTINPAVYRQVCFRIMHNFAVSQDGIPGGLQTSHIHLIFDQIKGFVLQQAIADAQTAG